MAQPILSEIWRYPVKSLRGDRHARLPIGSMGFAHDRHWMVVDAEGKFLSQRRLPRMALVRASIEGDQLKLSAPGQEDLLLPLTEVPGEQVPVEIWRDHCHAVRFSDEADFWLSDFLHELCRFVYLPDAEVRQVDPNYARPGDRTAFSDGYPVLLISQSSLDDLNSRLDSPVTMERFRPNLVVTGCEPFAEDGWKRIRIGGVEFRLAKPCSRCMVPTIDIERGEFAGEEPIKTLASYRSRDGKVFFGQNLIPDGAGELAEGMAVEVLE